MQGHEHDGQGTDGVGAQDRSQHTPQWAVLALTALTWLVLLPRILPGAFGDHGTFISVADRLRAGDRLYVDVWDNKDPLFYYGLAVARSVTPYGDLVLEVLWLGLAAVAIFLVGRSVGLDPTASLVVGGILTPIVLTGTTYVAGLTHLPAAAVILAVSACALRRRWLAAGFLLGVLVLLKLTAVPVALAAMAVIALHERTPPRPLLRAGAGAVLTATGVVGVMAARGELTAYAITQWGNVSYAQGPLLESEWGPVVAHLLKVAPEDGRTGALITVVGSLLTAALPAGGTAHPYFYLQAARSAPTSASTLAAVSDEARALAEVAETGSYARLGTNDTSAHARGLGGWELGCPRFHQYPFDPPEALSEVRGCLPETDAVLVDRSFGPQPGQPGWNEFVERARDLLGRGFTCSPAPFGQLCLASDTRAGGTGAGD